jgi:hypothetical protein
MDLLTAIINLFSDARSGGNLFYHLLTLLVLIAAQFVSLDHWRRDPEDLRNRRLAVAVAGLLLGRTALFVLAVVAPYTSAAALAAPLERILNLTSVLLISWALLTPPERAPVADTLLGVSLGLTLVGAFFSIGTWYPLGVAGQRYTSSDDEYAWTIAQLLLLGGALAVTLGRTLLSRFGTATTPLHDGVTAGAILAILFAGNAPSCCADHRPRQHAAGQQRPGRGTPGPGLRPASADGLRLAPRAAAPEGLGAARRRDGRHTLGRRAQRRTPDRQLARRAPHDRPRRAGRCAGDRGRRLRGGRAGRGPARRDRAQRGLRSRRPGVPAQPHLRARDPAGLP